MIGSDNCAQTHVETSESVTISQIAVLIRTTRVSDTVMMTVDATIQSKEFQRQVVIRQHVFTQQLYQTSALAIGFMIRIIATRQTATVSLWNP